jgi:hypothetical protein
LAKAGVFGAANGRTVFCSVSRLLFVRIGQKTIFDQSIIKKCPRARRWRALCVIRATCSHTRREAATARPTQRARVMVTIENNTWKLLK